MKGRKTKMMRVDERIKFIFEAVAKQIAEKENKPQPDKWSKITHKHMWFVCKNLYPDLTQAILKSYETAENILENDEIASEVIKNDSSNL